MGTTHGSRPLCEQFVPMRSAGERSVDNDTNPGDLVREMLSRSAQPRAILHIGSSINAAGDAGEVPLRELAKLCETIPRRALFASRTGPCTICCHSMVERAPGPAMDMDSRR